MGGSSAPKPPDPSETGAAQTGTNVSTALANAFMQNVNRKGPNGSLTYDTTGSYSFTDPNSGAVYDIPTFTATEQLSSAGKKINQQQNRAKVEMAKVGNDSAHRLGDVLGSELDLSGLPEIRNAPKPTTQVGANEINNDFSKDRRRVERALQERMQPGLDATRAARQSELLNAGIGYGTEAYGSAQDDLSRGENDARIATILAGGQEQSRQNADSLAQGQYNLGVQGQAFNQRQNRFQNDLAARNQGLQETFATRNQPINEITALLSGSQVSAPNFQVSTPGAIPTVDQAGLINANYDQKFAKWQQDQNSRNDLMGGLLGFGSGFISPW